MCSRSKTASPLARSHPAVVLEVKRHGRHGDRCTELASGELSQPGGVVVSNGKVYVTDGDFGVGRLLRINRGD